MSADVLFGVDQLLPQKNAFAFDRIALVTNDAATTSKGMSSRIALLKAGFSIIKLFSPEHGLVATGVDGVHQKNTFDPLTGLPVISLYGDKLMPDEEDLSDINLVLYDIPDVGCRFYTYLWTMTYLMDACSRYQKKLVILDRPNPIGGNFEMAEGPWLNEADCSSFIGRWNIPVRHSCTLGELARYFAVVKSISLDLQVIPVQNWKRNETIIESKWFFKPPSPAIKDETTALLYPGMGLLEGINVNEGRGTDTPFKIFGAPWIDAAALQEAFELLSLPGIKTQLVSYTPIQSLYAQALCHGLAFHSINHLSFLPVHTAYRLLQLLIRLHPDQCKERLYITHANPSGDNHLNKLTGITDAFNKIKNEEWPDNKLIKNEWEKSISPYLIYQ